MSHSEVSSEKVTSNSSNDERLMSLARCKISTSRLRAWSDHLQIHCRDGRITLSGHLPSFYLKQVLQTIVGDLPGVQSVDNAVEVTVGTGRRQMPPKDPSRPSS